MADAWEKKQQPVHEISEVSVKPLLISYGVAET